MYQLGKNPGYGWYYLASCPKYKDLLIENFPDSGSWANTFVVVSENFMFGPGESSATPVQWNTGTIGLFCPYV